MSTEFSFIILTLNEEQHLPRLLNSISGLGAETFILDSGSTDQTLNIIKQYQMQSAYHKFENHPLQWSYALQNFPIRTPWVIGLDADQVVTPELFQQLSQFKNKDFSTINGIYFNKKYIYKNKWLKHGGFYPKYLLKMFRYPMGYSDLNEAMDHKFQVPGKTIIWKKGHLIEENHKENSLSFWIEKHNSYSDQLALEEIEKIQKLRHQNPNINFWGSPNEQKAWMKRLWWSLPKYLRPILYFSYRIIIQRGLLDGKTGITYHFLQGFWFRFIIDVKIDEMLNAQQCLITSKQPLNKRKNPSVKFAIIFTTLFILLYALNLSFIGLTSPTGYYNEFLDTHLNYIRLWRNFNISSSASILRQIGYQVYTDNYRLHVEGMAGFRIVYSCLGYGILSLFSAFVIAYPKPIKSKFIFLIGGILVFQIFNTLRLVLIALYWKPTTQFLKIDFHDVFNIFIYLLMIWSVNYWLKQKPLLK